MVCNFGYVIWLILDLPSDFTVFPYRVVVCIWAGEGKDQLSIQYFCKRWK